MLVSIRSKLYRQTGFHYFLPLLFVGVFTFLRSFDLVALQPGDPLALSFTNTHFHASDHGAWFSHFMAELPADQEMESAEEKDENHSLLEALPAGSQDQLLFGSQALAVSLKIRLRQHEVSLSQTTPIPYFVLYHSWKSQLS